jgi:hypothetical protein
MPPVTSRQLVEPRQWWTLRGGLLLVEWLGHFGVTVTWSHRHMESPSAAGYRRPLWSYYAPPKRYRFAPLGSQHV